MEKQLKRLREYIKQAGLKQTTQRETVLRAFLRGANYANAEEITRQAQALDKAIGASTVYRCLKLFVDAGLAVERRFLHVKTCYEKFNEDGAQDHLICIRCGTVQEFVDPLIQAVQDKVSQKLDFKRTEHRMEIYGLCSTCQGPKSSRPEED